MIEIKYNCRTFLNARNQIVVRVRWNKKKSEVGFSTGMCADPLKWNSETQRPLRGSTHIIGKEKIPSRIINNRIDEFLEAIENAFGEYALHNQVPTPSELKELVNELIGRNKSEVAEDNEESDNDEDSDPDGDAPDSPEKMSLYFRMLGDYVYPSNNEFDIPTLLTDNMPVHLELPLNPWGAEARYKKGITTYHFYVDDYRFEQLFKDPIKLLESGCRAIVEPNCSIHDQTPMAHAIWQTYRKRYLCRYLQECGMQIWVDLNVSPHFEEVNALGVPEGYNAFCTRGVSGWLETTERHWRMAQRISGLDRPNMFVYGGGDDVAEWCKAHDVVHVKEFINRAKDKTEE